MIQKNLAPMVSEAAQLLTQLISIPAISREEGTKADFIEKYLHKCGANPHRCLNNIWCVQPDNGRPTLLLNAHIDTVRPVSGWKRSPFAPTIEGECIYGLGSNDCGGGLVTLMLTYLSLRSSALPWRLVFLASAEEEVSGTNGIRAVLPHLPNIDVAIVGEPTGMRPAIAEKGLMVLDCTMYGQAGHAAREEGDNAIYKALDDILWFRSHQFSRISSLLGPVKMSVTMINAGSQHNVIPDECHFVVDVRSNECYSNLELLSEIKRNVQCEVKPRSTRLGSSGISPAHPIVQAAVRLGGEAYGSPTLSDQALMPFPSFKIGPGQSSRSHTADEFIRLSELSEALRIYHALLHTEPHPVPMTNEFPN